MNLKAFDIARDTTGRGHEIAELGFKAVGLYLRGDRASRGMVDELHSAGVRVFSIWEKGEPTRAGYFSEARGRADATVAIAFAAHLGQPTGSPIFFCVDYDAASDEIATGIMAYLTATHAYCKRFGFLCGVYGSGLTCSRLVDAGVAHYGYLAGSRGFAGYDGFLGRAAIVQGAEDAAVLGLGVDLDTVVDGAVIW